MTKICYVTVIHIALIYLYNAITNIFPSLTFKLFLFLFSIAFIIFYISKEITININ